MAQKLFIGGLSFSTPTERLRELFAQIDGVQSVTIVTDRDTGQSRGFGFVEVETTEAANRAVAKLNGVQLDRRETDPLMSRVYVVDNQVDAALKQLKKLMLKEGTFQEMKRRAHYEKPSVKRKRKAAAARKKRRRALARSRDWDRD